jgi:hypothetical protein
MIQSNFFEVTLFGVAWLCDQEVRIKKTTL